MNKKTSFIFVDREQSRLDTWLMFWTIAFAVSLIYSKFVLSLGMIGIVGTLFIPKEGSWIDNIVYSFKRRKAFLGPIIIFLGVFLSGLNSDDMVLWVHNLRLKLPFLLLPIAVVLLPPIKEKAYFALVKIFILVCGISSIPVMVHYLGNFEEVNEAIGRGKPMDTPVNHIKYSLFVAFAAIVGIVLWLKEKSGTWQDKALLSLSIWLTVYLHILAVRSGLAVFYLTAFALIVYFVYKHKKFKLGAVLALGLILAPFVASKFVPSLFRKVGYMNYDHMMYQKGEGRTYSDSERLTSYKMGWDIAKRHMLLGTGIGDIKKECNDTYKKLEISNLKAVYPHNQYLFTWASMGLFGLFIFLIGSFWPLYYYRQGDIIFWILHGLLFTSYLVENTVERSTGIGFYLLFLLLALAVKRKA